MKFSKVLLTMSVITLASCGGSDDDTSVTSTGFFIDSAVEGLNYNSISTSGITGTDGSFEYVEGESVTFSVGGLELGSAAGSTYVTPISLIPGASASDISVINIVRLLLMLDKDGDSSNGINISAEVQATAESWSNIDFSDQSIDTLFSSLLAEVELADGREAVLISAQGAQNHVELSYACLSSGIYPGTFTGDTSGTFVLLIEPQRLDSVAFGDNIPRTGVTSAGVNSDEDEFQISGFSTGLSFDDSFGVVAGSLDSGAKYSGSLTDFNALEGTWRNNIFGESGTFSGERLGGDPSAVHRLSGIILTANQIPDAENFGYIAIDVFADNSAVANVALIDGTLFLFTGNYNAESGIISLSTDDHTLDVTFNAEGGNLGPNNAISTFAGSWEGLGDTGGVGGFSCKLTNS